MDQKQVLKGVYIIWLNIIIVLFFIFHFKVYLYISLQSVSRKPCSPNFTTFQSPGTYRFVSNNFFFLKIFIIRQNQPFQRDTGKLRKITETVNNYNHHKLNYQATLAEVVKIKWNRLVYLYLGTPIPNNVRY